MVPLKCIDVTAREVCEGFARQVFFSNRFSPLFSWCAGRIAILRVGFTYRMRWWRFHLFSIVLFLVVLITL